MTRRVLHQYCAAPVKIMHCMCPHICIGILSIFSFTDWDTALRAARKICSVYLSNLVEYLRGSRYYFKVVVLKNEMLFLMACSLYGIYNQVITKTSTAKPFNYTKRLTCPSSILLYIYEQAWAIVEFILFSLLILSSECLVGCQHDSQF